MTLLLEILTPTDFVALANQTLEFAYPLVKIEGEVLNFKVSRGRWVFFDVADEFSKVPCFCTVYMLPAPVEEGMRVRITAAPRLHPQYGFRLNLTGLQFAGEGTIKQASDLLRQQLEKEGLFALERKRALPYPPERIGLITSEESAAYRDFIKVLGARFGGLSVELADVHVQGESAPAEIVRAIEWFNKQADTVDVLVIIRGGGSADDLQAFSTEQVTRAVAASRIPTLVGVGHEVDVSLAELAADLRASTPSNAAELLVPDRRELLARLEQIVKQLERDADAVTKEAMQRVDRLLEDMHDRAIERIAEHRQGIENRIRTLEALSPQVVLRRGYAVVRKHGHAVKSAAEVRTGDSLEVQLADGHIQTEVH